MGQLREIQCNLNQPNKTKTKTIGFDTIEINLVEVIVGRIGHKEECST